MVHRFVSKPNCFLAKAVDGSPSPRRRNAYNGAPTDNRGGDFREHNVLNIDFEIGKLNLAEQEIDDLVAFLGRPLTDPRVLQQRAPFDHPQLFVPNGHSRDERHSGVTDEDVARDVFLEIPAVGRRGGPLPAGFLQ
jgi:hypothetical protein